MPEAGFPISATALLHCVAIVGRTGSGKTTAARGAVEALLRVGRRVVVIDPTGAWWGLRLSRDGLAAGFPISIFGGERADIDTPAEGGALLGEHLARWNQSAVVDTSLFSMGERRRFYDGFLRALYEHNRAPLHLIVDEADELAPQRPLPDQTMTLHHMERIVRRGRVRGFRPMLITQRPAVLNKNVLSQAGALVAMQLTAAQDRAALGAWIEGQADKAEAKAVLDTLPRLTTGEGWVWAPHEGPPVRARFPLAQTFDSGRTPEDGAAGVPSLPATKHDIEAIRAALRGVEKPEQRKPAARSLPAASTAADIQAAEQRGYDRGFQAGNRSMVERMAEQFRALARDVAARIRDAAAALEGRRIELPSIQNPASGGPDRSREERVAPSAPSAGSGRPSSKGGAEMRILRVLASRHPAQMTMAQWATLSGMKRSGGTWSTYVSRLRSAGRIADRDGLVFVTAFGLEAVPGWQQQTPQTPAELRAMWGKALGAGPARMIAALHAAGHRGLPRSGLAEAVGLAPSGGTFSTYLSRLRSNGVVGNGSDPIVLTSALREDIP